MPAATDNLSIRLPQDIREKVDAIARRSRRSRSFVLNEAIASYVRVQEQYSEEIAAALKSAEGGAGHSKDQIFAWLDSWREGERRTLPRPDVKPAK